MWIRMGWMVLVCAIMATPGLAADDGTPPGMSRTGARETESVGFALIEHNFWPVPRQITGDAPVVAPVQGRTRQGLRQRSAYLPAIYGAEVRHSLPPGILDALIWAESGYNPFAVSPVGAVGLAQLMPGTAKDLGVANRYDPSASINGGARYLRQMLDRFGTIHLALAAYNAGPGAVVRAGGIPLNGETPGYVARVMRRWIASDRTDD
jgi:soluble lytic murein transglycosylase-like protein